MSVWNWEGIRNWFVFACFVGGYFMFSHYLYLRYKRKYRIDGSLMARAMQENLRKLP